MNGVQPIPYELARFYVESDSGAKPYFVDLAQYGGVGCCDCPHFQFRCRPIVKDKTINEFGLKQARCKHLRRAREYFLDELIARMLATGIIQDDAKQK